MKEEAPENLYSMALSQEMRSMIDYTCNDGPAAFMATKARVRVRAAYLLSQWVQAPISDWREADT